MSLISNCRPLRCSSCRLSMNFQNVWEQRKVSCSHFVVVWPPLCLRDPGRCCGGIKTQVYLSESIHLLPDCSIKLGCKSDPSPSLWTDAGWREGRFCRWRRGEDLSGAPWELSGDINPTIRLHRVYLVSKCITVPFN